MQRTYSVHIGIRLDFLHGILYGYTIFATDVKVVSTCFAGPVRLWRTEESSCLAQSTEFPEGISAKEDVVFRVIAHHHFWPVYHRGHEEAQAMFSQLELFVVLDLNGTILQGNILKELCNHSHASLGSYYL